VQFIASSLATAGIDDDRVAEYGRSLRPANDLALDVDDHAGVGTRGRLCGRAES